MLHLLIQGLTEEQVKMLVEIVGLKKMNDKDIEFGVVEWKDVVHYKLDPTQDTEPTNG